MIPHYLRKFEYETYLVPEKDIDGFDKLVGDIEDASDDPDQIYDMYEQFNNAYQQYKQEGDLGTKKLYLDM